VFADRMQSMPAANGSEQRIPATASGLRFPRRYIEEAILKGWRAGGEVECGKRGTAIVLQQKMIRKRGRELI
jgi:hypothetical protein